MEENETDQRFRDATVMPEMQSGESRQIMFQQSNFKMQMSKYRVGQLGAHQAIVDMILDGVKRIISIVLPTRYGKSALQVLTFLDLWSRGAASVAIMLNPAIFLSQQIIDKEKVDETLSFFEVQSKNPKLYYIKSGKNIFIKFRGFLQQIEHQPVFISMTMPMAITHREEVFDFINATIVQTGKPPIVYVDEAALCSDVNRSGETIRKFESCGAIVIVLTATPVRQDGEVIPGFDKEVADETIATHHTWEPGEKEDTIKVSRYVGIRQFFKLKADYEYGYPEAWAESPSPLCHISRTPFDVNISKYLPKSKNEKRTLLSELNGYEVRNILGKIVRDREVIETGCNILVDRVKELKENNPKFKAIVYCGNDNEDDGDVNAHAKEIKGVINSICDFKVKICTSAIDEDTSQVIKDFVSKNKWDILIVKMMASLGIDDENLKVELDFSAVRTTASYQQRLMRIATPAQDFRHAIYIAPDDILSRDLYEQLVKNQGGDISCLKDLELEAEWEKPKEDREKPLYVINGTCPADYEDTKGTKALAETQGWVEAVLSEIPQLHQIHTMPEIGVRLGTAYEKINGKNTQAEDVSGELSKLNSRINAIVTEIANLRFRRQFGRNYQGTPLDQDSYKHIIKGIRWDAYRAIGLPSGVKSIKDVVEPLNLRKILAYLKEMKDEEINLYPIR